MSHGPSQSPDSMMADTKSRSDAGDTSRCWQTEKPPADWPKTVTRDRSPPNRLALRCAVVAKGAAVVSELVQRDPTERVQPVVGRDDDYAVLLCEGGSIKPALLIVRAEVPSAAVDPLQHGARRLLRARRGDVHRHVEAVLAADPDPLHQVELWAHRREASSCGSTCIAQAEFECHRGTLRKQPAALAGRRCRKWNAVVRDDRALATALHRPVVAVHDRSAAERDAWQVDRAQQQRRENMFR
eukprot:1703479-Prymnesium_polylepis.1